MEKLLKMEELKKYIEDAIDGLTKSLFTTITDKSETDTSSLQAHIWGQMFAYKAILEKLNNIKE